MTLAGVASSKPLGLMSFQDLEVVPKESTGEVLSVEDLARNDRLLGQYDGPHQAVEIVRSRENNSSVSHPVGTRDEWK